MGAVSGGAVGGARGASVLQTSPEELRAAARLLRGIGEELETLGGRTVSATRLGDGWAGLAALEQQARASSVQGLVVLAAMPGRQVAGALEQCAGVAEASAVRVRTWTRRIEDGVAELAVLRGQGPPPEPLLEAAWRRRLAEVEGEVVRARRFVDEAEGEFDRAQQEAARVISGAWAVVEEVTRLGTLAKQVRRATTQIPWAVVHTVRTTQMAIDLARARWARSAAVRALALQRAREWTGLVRALLVERSKVPVPVGMARFAPGPQGVVLTWLAALSDARHGGGYEGWRGDTTRVLATGALVGGPLTLAGVIFAPLAPLAPVGLGLVGVYSAWTLGNVVWDGAPVVARYVRLAVRHAPLARQAVAGLATKARVRAADTLRDLRSLAAVGSYRIGVEVRERVDDVREDVGRLVAPLRDPGRWVIGLPGQGGHGIRVKEALGQVVDRLPDTEPLRRRLREVGMPIRLPSTPLGPVLRAPVDLGWPPAPGAG